VSNDERCVINQQYNSMSGNIGYVVSVLGVGSRIICSLVSADWHCPSAFATCMPFVRGAFHGGRFSQNVKLATLLHLLSRLMHGALRRHPLYYCIACCLSIEIEHNPSKLYLLKLINMETAAITRFAVLRDYYFL